MESEAIALASAALYEAAATPDAWPGALQGMARATGSVGCRLRPVHLRPEDVAFPASPDIQGFLKDFASEGWLRADLRTLRGASLAESGRSVVIEHDVTTEEERRRSPFYQTLSRRHDLPWWAAIIFDVDGRKWCASILRTAAQGPFTPSDARCLANAAAHLGGAASLASKFDFAYGLGAVEALERIGRAAFVLDGAGLVVMANSRAEQRAAQDLKLVHSRLRAADAASDRRLQALIAEAVAPRVAGTAPPEPIFIARREGRPIMVEALPATGPMRDVFRRIAALVVITDLNARAKPADALIREAFGLTKAEGRLAAALAAGEDLRNAADCLGVAYETARVQLKAIFGKMQVSRQAELAAVLARLAPGREKEAPT
jgi:DNA-binding CsgD family transcriptional regulator